MKEGLGFWNLLGVSFFVMVEIDQEVNVLILVVSDIE